MAKLVSKVIFRLLCSRCSMITFTEFLDTRMQLFQTNCRWGTFSFWGLKQLCWSWCTFSPASRSSLLAPPPGANWVLLIPCCWKQLYEFLFVSNVCGKFKLINDLSMTCGIDSDVLSFYWITLWRNQSRSIIKIRSIACSRDSSHSTCCSSAIPLARILLHRSAALKTNSWAPLNAASLSPFWRIGASCHFELLPHLQDPPSSDLYDNGSRREWIDLKSLSSHAVNYEQVMGVVNLRSDFQSSGSRPRDHFKNNE